MVVRDVSMPIEARQMPDLDRSDRAERTVRSDRADRADLDAIGDGLEGQAPAKVDGGSFGSFLIDAMKSARSEEGKAVDSAESFARGEIGVHEVMIAQEKAAIAVRYAVTLKNRALEAYRELMNTQV